MVSIRWLLVGCAAVVLSQTASAFAPADDFSDMPRVKIVERMPTEPTPVPHEEPSPIDQFLEVPADSKPFEIKQTWSCQVPTQSATEGAQVAWMILSRQIDSGSARICFDETMSEAISEGTLLKGKGCGSQNWFALQVCIRNGATGNCDIVARAWILDKDRISQLIGADVTSQQRLTADRLMILANQCFSDGAKLQTLANSWRELGKPATAEELYVALARGKGCPIVGLASWEIAKIWGTNSLREIPSANSAGREREVTCNGKKFRIFLKKEYVSWISEVSDAERGS